MTMKIQKSSKKKPHKFGMKLTITHNFLKLFIAHKLVTSFEKWNSTYLLFNSTFDLHDGHFCLFINNIQIKIILCAWHFDPNFACIEYNYDSIALQSTSNSQLPLQFLHSKNQKEYSIVKNKINFQNLKKKQYVTKRIMLNSFQFSSFQTVSCDFPNWFLSQNEKISQMRKIFPFQAKFSHIVTSFQRN